MPLSPMFSGQPLVRDRIPAIREREFDVNAVVIRLQMAPFAKMEYFKNMWPPL